MYKLLPLHGMLFLFSCSTLGKWHRCPFCASPAVPNHSLLSTVVALVTPWCDCLSVWLSQHWTMSSQKVGLYFFASESQALNICPQIVDISIYDKTHNNMVCDVLKLQLYKVTSLICPRLMKWPGGLCTCDQLEILEAFQWSGYAIQILRVRAVVWCHLMVVLQSSLNIDGEDSGSVDWHF